MKVGYSIIKHNYKMILIYTIDNVYLARLLLWNIDNTHHFINYLVLIIKRGKKNQQFSGID